MNRGLLLRAFRESWPATLVIGLVLLGVEALLAFVLPRFSAPTGAGMAELDFVRSIIQAMLGTEIAGRIGPPMFQAIAWVHPVALALLWAHATISCTRVPAGEVTAARWMCCSACRYRGRSCSSPKQPCGCSPPRRCSWRDWRGTCSAAWRCRPPSGPRSRGDCSSS